VLSQFFRFLPVCPEFEVGMGIPREAVHLAGDPDSPLMIGSRSGEDWTGRMHRYNKRRVEKIAGKDLSGYILKKDSPSCGMERVKVKNEKGMPSKIGVGLYAKVLMERLPLLPVEEEGRLNDVRLRENWIVRVFAYHRLRELFRRRFRRGEVVDFHARHKYLLMAHSPKHYKSLGQLVAAVKQFKPTEFRDRYCEEFMTALQVKATTRKHVNVLQHIAGYLKKRMDDEEKSYLIQTIEEYRQELVPLIVPMTLINLFLRKYEVEYIDRQWYLQPHPQELLLRNHV